MKNAITRLQEIPTLSAAPNANEKFRICIDNQMVVVYHSGK